MSLIENKNDGLISLDTWGRVRNYVLIACVARENGNTQNINKQLINNVFRSDL